MVYFPDELLQCDLQNVCGLTADCDLSMFLRAECQIWMSQTGVLGLQRVALGRLHLVYAPIGKRTTTVPR